MIVPADRLLPIIDRILVNPIPICDGASLHKLLTLCRARIEADSAWASISEIVARKAFDVTHAAIVRFGEGHITKAEAIAAVSAVLDVATGPVEPRELDLIHNALKELQR